MDPLSLTASIIAVIGAARSAARAVSLLKAVKIASKELSELLDEVSQTEIVLQAFRNVSDFQEPLPALSKVLGVARIRLVELNSVIHYSLINGKVERWQWIRKRTDNAVSRASSTHQASSIQSGREQLGLFITVLLHI